MQAFAKATSPEKQWKTVRSGAPSSSSTRRISSWASRSWMTRAKPCRLAISMCARKDASWAAQPSGPVRKRSRPVSPTARTRGSPASRSISARAVSSAWPSPASLGCTATVASTFGCRAASSADHRDEGTSTPTCTRRGMPTAAAAAISASTSASSGHPSSPAPCAGRSPTTMSRWVWLSIAGRTSGSGDGGGSPRRLAREDADRLTAPTSRPKWPLRPGGSRPKWPLRPWESRAGLVFEPGQFLVDDRRVQLGEDRLRRRQRRPGRGERRRGPDGLSLLVGPGDDGVRRAVVEVGDLVDLRGDRPDAVPTEQLVHLLRRVREERRQQGVAVLDRLERGVEDRVAAGRVLLELPRRLVRQVLVRLADDPHRLADRGLLPVARQQVADRSEGPRGRGQQLAVVVGELAGRGHRTDVLGGHRHGAVDQVAPPGDQLVVVAAQELRPGEVGVLVLRPGDGDEVAQRVGVVAGQEVADVDDDVPRGGELAPLHGEELAGDDLGGQVERPQRAGGAALVPRAVVAEHLGRPDLGVEDDVVLAHE